MTKLVATNVTKEYPTRAESLRVLDGVSLELLTGQNVAIVGPSGSGKSTLLHILGTLEQPTSGTVTLDGVDPAKLDEAALAHFRYEQIGFVFQDHHLLPQCSVLENVLVPALAEGRVTPEKLDRAKQLLQRVGLQERLEHRPAKLSGGERQRTALARALINRPRLLLADEPTGNLDSASAHQVGQLLLELQAGEEMLLVVVTHSSELAALLQRRLRFENGQLQPMA